MKPRTARQWAKAINYRWDHDPVMQLNVRAGRAHEVAEVPLATATRTNDMTVLESDDHRWVVYLDREDHWRAL